MARPERIMSQEEIVAALRERKAKQVHIAGLLGIAPVKVSKAFAGIRRFTAEETIVLLRFLGALPDPAAERQDARQSSPSRAVRTASGARMLPVVGLVPAGNWREAVENTDEYMLAPDPDLADDAFVVEVEGDSMNRVAPPGTRVVIDPQDKRLITGKIYVVRNVDGDVTLKQYMSDPARLVPCSDNDQHREIVLGEDEPGIIIGRAVWRSTRM